MLTEQGRANVFRVIGRDDAQGIVAGNYLADHWGDKKIAILHDGTTYGKGLADETKKQLNKRGVTEAIYEAYAPGEERLFGRDRCVAGGGYRRVVCRRVSYRGRAHGPCGTRPRLLGSARLGRCPGDRGVWPHRRSRGRGHSLHLLSPTRAETPKRRRSSSGSGPRTSSPQGYTLLSYAAVQVWAQAVEKAGSLELASGDRVTARPPVRHRAWAGSTSTTRATSRLRAGYGMSGRAASTCRWNNARRSRADRFEANLCRPCWRHRSDRRVAAMLERLGIRGRLLLAFFGISTFAVLATAAALYAFLQVGEVVERITERPGAVGARVARSCPARPSGSPPPRRPCWRRPARLSTTRSRLRRASRWRASRSCSPR